MKFYLLTYLFKVQQIDDKDIPNNAKWSSSGLCPCKLEVWAESCLYGHFEKSGGYNTHKCQANLSWDSAEQEITKQNPSGKIR